MSDDEIKYYIKQNRLTVGSRLKWVIGPPTRPVFEWGKPETAKTTAATLGFSPQHLYNIYKGVKLPTVDFIKTVAREYNIDIEFLIGLSDHITQAEKTKALEDLKRKKDKARREYLACLWDNYANIENESLFDRIDSVVDTLVREYIKNGV